MFKLVLGIFIFFIFIGCGKENLQNSPSPPKENENTRYYTRLDGSAIKGDENIILSCMKIGSQEAGLCESVCISQVLPQYVRYDLYMSDWMPEKECQYFIFGSDFSYEYYGTNPSFVGNKIFCLNAGFKHRGKYEFTSYHLNLTREDKTFNSYLMLGLRTYTFHLRETDLVYVSVYTCLKREEITKELIERVQI